VRGFGDKGMSAAGDKGGGSLEGDRMVTGGRVSVGTSVLGGQGTRAVNWGGTQGSCVLGDRGQGLGWDSTPGCPPRCPLHGVCVDVKRDASSIGNQP